MFRIENVTILYKKDLRTLVKDFSLTVRPLDKIAVIGEEGNGKSTLLKWMYDPGLVEDYAEVSGKRIVQNTVQGYLPQELPETDREKSVYGYLSEENAFLEATPGEIAELSRKTGLPSEFFYEDRPMRTLSGGEKIKIETVRIMVKKPSLYFLDEPSNDLDQDTLEWLESFIREEKAAFVYISHDEVLLENTAERTDFPASTGISPLLRRNSGCS